VASGLLSLLGAFEHLELPVHWWNTDSLAASETCGLDDLLEGHREFSNRVLWPLCHDVGIPPARTPGNARAYRDINEKMASMIAQALKRTHEHPLLLIHDFHFAGVPGMLRNLGVRNPMGFFWHIPFPESRMLGRIPEGPALMRSLAQTDTLGVHTKADAARHAACLRAFGREPHPRGGAQILPAAPARPPSVGTRVISHSTSPRITLLGIDRLDYTKGLLQKFEAIDRTLEARPHLVGRLRLVQVAAPTRSDLPEYRSCAASVRELATRVNSRWSSTSAPRDRVIVLVEKILSPRQMAALHAHSDIALITPLRDGMNLVAKEYVLSRFAPGSPPAALVLSRQAGAAEELCDAHLVDATAPDDISRGLCEALDESVAARVSRMGALYGALNARDAGLWAEDLVRATLRAYLSRSDRGHPNGLVLPWAHERQAKLATTRERGHARRLYGRSNA